MKRLAIILAACGTPPVPPATPSGPPAAMTAATADLVVATVNGRPVHASCVKAQHSLDQCIAFELMAQAAEARGLATDPEVVAETRRALVSQVVAKEYEDAYTKPSDFGSTWDRLVELNRALFDHDDMRASAYVRVEVPKNAPAEIDTAAHQLADDIAKACAPERGMMPEHLFAIGHRVAEGRKLTEAPVPPHRITPVDPGYGQALFAIPEIGRCSPATRTRWGYDVILYAGLDPATHPSQEQLAERILPDIKRSYFNQWVDKVAKDLGVRVELFKDNLAKLEALK